LQRRVAVLEKERKELLQQRVHEEACLRASRMDATFPGAQKKGKKKIIEK